MKTNGPDLKQIRVKIDFYYKLGLMENRFQNGS